MKKRLKKGLVHIYTGSGKGKTTAGIGIGLRAARAGLKVCMLQFLKKKGSAADNGLAFPGFKVICFDETHPLFGGSREKLEKKIIQDVGKAKKLVKSGRFDVIILDEIINCISGKFIPAGAVLDLIESKPECVELVLTGRGAPRKLIACADYVTNLNKIKHPFDSGIAARCGIEY